MTYTGLSLAAVALALGLLWILSHLPALLWPARVAPRLRAFPRSVPAGIALMAAAVAWGAGLAATIDLGEFSRYRPTIVGVAIVLGLLMIAFSREYLAVRGLAALVLLGANLVLDAAFLRDTPAKLVLVTAAYVAIVAALVLLFSPYRLRDALAWATRDDRRLRLLAGLGIAWGLVLLGLGLFAY